MSQNENNQLEKTPQKIEPFHANEIQDELTVLNPKELSAYRYWQSNSQPELSPQLSLDLFALFLHGNSCEEIRKLNPALTLGQIVHSRIKYSWDDKMRQHMNDLQNSIMDRVRMVTLESVNFVADLLSAANKLHGTAIKKYLQTGDPEHLSGLKIDSLQGYKAGVELMQKLTGQDKFSNTNVSGTVTVKSEGTLSGPTAEEQSKVLKLLLGK